MNNATFIPYQRPELKDMSTEELCMSIMRIRIGTVWNGIGSHIIFIIR